MEGVKCVATAEGLDAAHSAFGLVPLHAMTDKNGETTYKVGKVRPGDEFIWRGPGKVPPWAKVIDGGAKDKATDSAPAPVKRGPGRPRKVPEVAVGEAPSVSEIVE